MQIARTLAEIRRDAPLYLLTVYLVPFMINIQDAPNRAGYRKQMDYMNSLDRNLTRVKLYRNAFLRNTAMLECDAQDRIVIPKPLMEMYSIDKELVMVLDNGQIEMWNSKKYHEKFDMTPEELEKLNEEMHLGHYLPEKEGSNGIS